MYNKIAYELRPNIETYTILNSKPESIGRQKTIKNDLFTLH